MERLVGSTLALFPSLFASVFSLVRVFSACFNIHIRIKSQIHHHRSISSSFPHSLIHIIPPPLTFGAVTGYFYHFTDKNRTRSSVTIHKSDEWKKHFSMLNFDREEIPIRE